MNEGIDMDPSCEGLYFIADNKPFLFPPQVDLNLKTSVPSEGVVVHLLRGKIPPPMDMDDDYPEPHDHHRWGKCSSE